MIQSQFSKNLRALRDKKGLTQKQVAEAVDVDVLTYGNWERKGKIPRQRETIERLCDFFGVTENELFGYSDGFFSKATGLEQSFGLPLKTSPESAFLPYLGHAHAGEFADPITIDDNVVEVPKSVADRHPRGRVITVDGDCVNRVIPSGSIAVVDPDVEPQSGSLVCASIDSGDFILRRMFRGGRKLMLSPDSFNEEYDDMIFDENDEHELDLIGTVVWHQAAREME